jgi:hypothetical protein
MLLAKAELHGWPNHLRVVFVRLSLANVVHGNHPLQKGMIPPLDMMPSLYD